MCHRLSWQAWINSRLRRAVGLWTCWACRFCPIACTHLPNTLLPTSVTGPPPVHPRHCCHVFFGSAQLCLLMTAYSLDGLSHCVHLPLPWVWSLEHNSSRPMTDMLHTSVHLKSVRGVQGSHPDDDVDRRLSSNSNRGGPRCWYAALWQPAGRHSGQI